MNIAAAIVHDQSLGIRYLVKMQILHRKPFFAFVVLLFHIRIVDLFLYIYRTVDVLHYISSSVSVVKSLVWAGLLIEYSVPSPYYNMISTARKIDNDREKRITNVYILS